MQEMQNATRQALTDSISLFHSFSAGSLRRSLRSVGEEGAGSVIPRPTDHSERDLQRPDSTALIFQMPMANGGTMHTMARQSQLQILSTGSDKDDSGYGWSLRFLTTYPRCIASTIAIPAALQLVLMSWLTLAGYANSAALTLNLVSTGVYAILAIASVALLDKAWRSSHFEIAVARLYLLVDDFKLRWNDASRTQWRRCKVAWLVNVGSFAATQVLQVWADQQEDAVSSIGIQRSWVYAIGAVSVVSYGISSAFVLLTAFIQTDLLLGLDKSLDCWCCQIVNHNMDFNLGVDSWNAVQALLKSVARELASSFLALQILSGLGFVYFLAVGVTFVFRSEHRPLPLLVEGLSSLPLVWLFLLSLHVSSHGAELTEKCQGIPAFVNQIWTRNSMDTNRQYLVRFISDSSAGFIVRDTKLTRELFMKQLFLFVGLVSALVSVLSRLYF